MRRYSTQNGVWSAPPATVRQATKPGSSSSGWP